MSSGWARETTDFALAALVFLTVAVAVLLFRARAWKANWNVYPLPRGEEVTLPNGQRVPAPLHVGMYHWTLRPSARGIGICGQGLLFVLLLAGMARDMWSVADDFPFSIEWGTVSYKVKGFDVVRVSYSHLCESFTSEDLMACNTLRAAGAFTLAYGIAATLIAAVLFVKLTVIACRPAYSRWARWMDTAGHLQCILLGGAVLVWSISAHVTIHALDAVNFSASWSLAFCSWFISFWLTSYYHNSIQYRPDDSPLDVGTMIVHANQQQPRMMVIHGTVHPVYEGVPPPGGAAVREGQPAVARAQPQQGHAQPAVAYAQPQQGYAQPAYAQQAFAQQGGYPMQQQGSSTQPDYPLQPGAYGSPQGTYGSSQGTYGPPPGATGSYDEPPPAYTASSSGDSGMEGAPSQTPVVNYYPGMMLQQSQQPQQQQQQGTRAASSSNAPIVWADVTKPSRPPQ